MTRADLKAIIARWVPDASAADAEAEILRALRSLQVELGIGEEVIADISVAGGAASATIPNTVVLVENAFWQPSSDNILLQPVPYRHLSGELRASNQNAVGTPQYYASTGTSLYLWERPSANGTLRVVGLGAFSGAHNMDNDADTVHPSFAEPAIIAYKAILNMLIGRRQAMTVYKEVLPVYRVQLRQCRSGLKGIQGQHGAPSVRPMPYSWSEY